MRTTIKEFAILALIGMVMLNAMVIDIATTLSLIPFAVLFAILMYFIIGIFYPSEENKLDKKIDNKALEQ